MNGSITNNWLRDFYFDLNLIPTTSISSTHGNLDNEMYYGKAIGTGIVNIKGKLDDD